MKIIVDAFGGDNAPEEIVNASLLALYNHRDLKITLVGKSEVIQDNLINKKYDQARLDIVDAREVIGPDEHPVEAIRTKKDSSIVRGIELLKSKPDEYIGFVSAGSTGALLSAAVLKLGRLKGISRPALAPLLPTAKGTPVLLIDAGANMDVKPINLVQFALMGSAYMSEVFGVSKPRVGLLNVGTEDSKGNILAKESFPLLKQLPVNFVGNMEARYLLSGDYDVVVADGFDGNVLLKSTEGACKILLKEIKAAMLGSLSGKIGALFLKKSLKRVAKKFDYEGLSAAVLLGVKGLVVKGHGSCKAREFLSTIEHLITMGGSNINKTIEATTKDIDLEHLMKKAEVEADLNIGKGSPEERAEKLAEHKNMQFENAIKEKIFSKEESSEERGKVEDGVENLLSQKSEETVVSSEEEEKVSTQQNSPEQVVENGNMDKVECSLGEIIDEQEEEK